MEIRSQVLRIKFLKEFHLPLAYEISGLTGFPEEVSGMVAEKNDMFK